MLFTSLRLTRESVMSLNFMGLGGGLAAGGGLSRLLGAALF